MISVSTARGFARLLGTIPPSWLPRVAKVVSAPLCLIARKDADRMRRNVAAALDLPPRSPETRAFLSECTRHHVVSILETIRGIWAPEELVVEGMLELRQNLQRASSSGKGVVLITGHIGSWELCALFAARACPNTLHVLAKPLRSSSFNRVLDDFRRRMGVNVIWTDRPTLMQDVVRAVRAGESVGFVMDQKPKDRKGPRVEFFGMQTEFVAGPAFAAAKTDCGIVSVFCLRTGPSRYRLVSRLLYEPEHGKRDLTALTQEMASEIERVIRMVPQQWTWNYRRWRKV